MLPSDKLVKVNNLYPYRPTCLVIYFLTYCPEAINPKLTRLFMSKNRKNNNGPTLLGFFSF